MRSLFADAYSGIGVQTLQTRAGRCRVPRREFGIGVQTFQALSGPRRESRREFGIGVQALHALAGRFGKVYACLFNDL